ncbi:MAG TPA: hypothetical protein VFJ06_11620 [Halococcus sp.]|nr:hypothetical protein [Halococcus sp.]
MTVLIPMLIEGLHVLLQTRSDILLTPTLETVLGGAVIFFGLSLLVWGDFAREGGNVTATSAGYVSVLAGGLGFIWGAAFLFRRSIIGAMVVAVFGMIFIDAGWHTINDTELGGHGVLNLGMTGVTAIVAIFFSLTPATYLLALAGWSYVLALLAFGGFCYWGGDRWRRFFVGICFFDGAITTCLYGVLLILGWAGFGL